MSADGTVSSRGTVSSGETMRAYVLTGHGGLDKLEWRQDWPKPSAAAGEVLLRVLACGLNNTDVNTRTAWYSKVTRGGTGGEAAEGSGHDGGGWGGTTLRFPRIQGADVCGRIEAIGGGADPALVGKRALVDTWLRDWDDPMNLAKCRYFGSEADGGFAEYVAVDARQVHPIESELEDAELATFATSYITAENMLNRAGVGAEDTVLVPGASGGVGGALIHRKAPRCAGDRARLAEQARGGRSNRPGPHAGARAGRSAPGAGGGEDRSPSSPTSSAGRCGPSSSPSWSAADATPAPGRSRGRSWSSTFEPSI